MKYELREGITKGLLEDCKFDATTWTDDMKVCFQDSMFGLNIFWSSSSSPKILHLEEGLYYFYVSGGVLTYGSYESTFLTEDEYTTYAWKDIFEPVATGIKLNESNFNKHVLSESLSPEELVGLKVKEDSPLKPHKSSGGSSKYYEVVLPQWLLDKQSEKGFIMLEDLAEVMFDNDFNYTNIFKAQKRMFDLQNGGGKVGNTLDYDATKCKYYINKQVEVFNRDK